MTNCETVSSQGALGEKIGCVTLTKQFFEKNKITNNDNKELPISFSEFKGLPVQYMNQVHGKSVGIINNFSNEPIPNTDALFTKSNKVSLAIMSADCLPVAITNTEGTEIALLHAGWKGLSSGIIQETLKIFNTENKGLKSWLAPCISQMKYEVGIDVYEAFMNLDEESVKNFQQVDSKKWLFDLKAEAARVLINLNVQVFQSNYCTYTDKDMFYSYRRNKTDKRVLTLLWRKNV
mgnify:FL=1|tara:strand:+ start:850 stop:1554 length:705 start_codon:yes stop_codon:yes gene_type:complete